jgi:hypothetical protein
MMADRCCGLKEILSGFLDPHRCDREGCQSDRDRRMSAAPDDRAAEGKSLLEENRREAVAESRS